MEKNQSDQDSKTPSRRDFLTTTTSWAMLGGMAAGYGSFAWISGRYLYPSRPRETKWLFVKQFSHFAVGDSLPFRTPDGATISIARTGKQGNETDFVALSSVCPHLGCQVHWEAQNKRFFCPCHNGVFDLTGKATAGPPQKAGQSLTTFPLKLEHGILYIQVPVSEESEG